MELVFFWIQSSKNGFIQNQGFNLCGEHRFQMEIKDDNYLLSYLFDDAVLGSAVYKNAKHIRNINNISAFVGENGSGKTTILQAITSLNFFKVREPKSENYIDYQEKCNHEQQNVIVYKNGGGEFVVYDNLPVGVLTVMIPTHIRFSANALADEAYLAAFEEFCAIQTIIYLTNGQYKDGMTTEDKLKELYLTPTSLAPVAKQFIEKVCRFPQLGAIKLSPFNQLHNMLIANYNVLKFQEVCDIIYYHKLKSFRGVGKDYLSKLCDSLEVSIVLVSKQIENSRINGRFTLTSEEIEKWKVRIEETNTNRTFLSKERNSISERLGYNLLWELLFCYEVPLDEIKCLDDFEAIEKLVATKVQSDEKSYYEKALGEIREFTAICDGCPEIDNVVPEKDLAYRFGKTVSLVENNETFWAFCELINKFARADYSFVLKYLNIDGLHMSSGERAMQNIFSWLNLLPFFETITGKPASAIHNNNMLLMIDEIDLYCHPEWQRRLINYTMNELCNQFPDNNIQLVITTHSPLILSDIPVENCCFLKPQGGRFHIDDKPHKQTFAANIYDILAGGFFMEKTLGAFSDTVICDVYEDLKNRSKTLTKEEFAHLEKKIATIGEPIRQKSLKILLEKAKKANTNINLQKAMGTFYDLTDDEKIVFIKTIQKRGDGT